MNVEYSNQVVGSDFRTTSENFIVEGKFRKDAASNTIIELHAGVRPKQEPHAAADEVGFWGGELRYTLYGKTVQEFTEIVNAIESTLAEISAPNQAAE